jgi:hypothetical protein
VFRERDPHPGGRDPRRGTAGASAILVGETLMRAGASAGAAARAARPERRERHERGDGASTREGGFGAYGGAVRARGPNPRADRNSTTPGPRSVMTRRSAGSWPVLSVVRIFVGRPDPDPPRPLPGLSDELGSDIWRKREVSRTPGAHKINNAIGQVLLAKRAGKTRIIAETGAGQHGVATATAVCSRVPCVVYNGRGGHHRQARTSPRCTPGRRCPPVTAAAAP